jgi:amidohydrolase
METIYNRSQLISLRRKLHQYPELSGNEYQTAQIIREALEETAPDRIIEHLGGAGLAAVYEGSSPGPTLLFRCDLDALPIEEVNTFEYKSQYTGVAHKCGHDGHMTIITGLAMAISANRPEKGKVVLLYQPSEENGQGAARVLEDKQFETIQPDYVFALHNLPGFPAGAVVLRKDTFAAASKGMINKLYGKTAHAGEPENGLTPAPALAGIIQELSALPQNGSFEDFTLTTIIHARLGEVAFGTTPGYAEVMATLRTWSNTDMEQLTRQSVDVVQRLAHSYGLKSEISWTEEFPATVNDSQAVDLIEQVARENQLQVIHIDEPLRWSEDFSNFTLQYPGALFGLGSGEETPQLHNPDYDFPEEIIDRGIEIFYGIYLHHFK